MTLNDAALTVSDEKVDFQKTKDSIRVVLAQISPAYDPEAFASDSLVKIGSPERQTDKIRAIIQHACTVGADVLLFPELVAPFSHVRPIEETIQKAKKDIVVCIPYEHTSVRDLRAVLPHEEIEQHECIDDADDDRIVNFCRITAQCGGQSKTYTQIKLTPFSVEFSLAASDTLVCGNTVYRFVTNWGNFLFLICKDYVGEIGTEKKTPMFDFLKSLTTTGLHYVFVSSLNPEPEAFLHAARSFYYMQEKSKSTFSIFLNIAELDNTTIVFPVRPHPGIRPTKKLEMIPLFAGKPSWGTQLRFPGYQERLVCGTFVRLDTYEPMATKEIYSPIHHTELIDLAELGIESKLVELPKGVAVKEKRKKVRHNLPAQPTQFLGREKELAKIAEQFKNPACRLVTILGPGGMGKTRLGIESASQMIPEMKDGVYFVPLAPLSSGDFIISTIANSLGLSFRGRDEPKVQLLNYLREKNTLLVMDNFEHLVDRTALVAEILEAAAGVKIIATSRERLNLKGEWIFNLEGMDCPDKEDVDADECAVVQLFLEGAQRVRPDFSPTEEDMQRVVRICQLVEGMPLAVELASAWMTVLGPDEIVEEIEQNIDFLSTSMRDVPERHRSMRAVFEHSWKLLADSERKMFMKMSVFRGGFLKDAAKKTVQASLLHLSSLVNKSLLQHYPSGRYVVHELLRQYAGEKLGEVSEEKEKMQDLHSEFYADFLHQREELLKGEKQRDVLRQIGEEIENIRAAWLRAGSKGKLNVIDKSVRSLWRFCMIRGWFQDGEEMYARVAENLREKKIAEGDRERDLVLGKVVARQGVFSYQLGQYEHASELFENSIHIFRELDAQQEVADTLNEYSRVYFIKGDYTKAKDILEECLTICKKTGYRKGMAAPYTTLGNIAYRLGELEEARKHYQKSYNVYRECADRWGMAILLMNLANVSHEVGEHVNAKKLYEESLAISKEIGDRRGIAANLNNMGNVAKELGEYVEAKELYRRSLRIKRETGDRKGIAASLGNLGNVASALGEYDEAKQRHHEMLALCKDIGYPWGIVSALVSLGNDAFGQGECDEAKQYYGDGLRMAIEASAVPLALDAIVGLASLMHDDKEKAVVFFSFVDSHPSCYVHTKKTVEQRCSDFAAQLPADVVNAAKQGGRTMELETIAAQLLGETK